ncbi:glycoside hydrolase family 18 protein [Lyophyllum atratum]|nr:glycoside hydrolase family 18 protein [Lyophyllum atratum]
MFPRSQASRSATSPSFLSTQFLFPPSSMAFGRFKRVFYTTCLLFTATRLFLPATAFDNSRSDNLAVYYGQNSYGATNADPTNSQKTLSAYCQDDTINAIPLAFLHVLFSAGGLPEIDLANTCNSNNGNVFPGTRLAMCPSLTDDIKACQARGKIVTISIGGATGVAGFDSDAQARTFAETVWNVFLGGSSDTRPFGDAVLDGVDLDIEGGSGTGLAAFVSRIRELSQGKSKKYYVTAAPQCPFPDVYLGSVISAVGFDAIYVQCESLGTLDYLQDFKPLPQYNNYCGVNNYNNPNAWNFGVWDNWAKTTSPNKNVKVYIGAPAAGSAAGSGYVSASTLGEIARETRAKYSSFGGIMLWDASQAHGNSRYDVAVKTAMDNGDDGDACPPDTTTTETPATIPTTITTSKTTSSTSSTIITTSNAPTTTMTTTNASTTTSSSPISTLTPSSSSTSIATPPSPTSTSASGSCVDIAGWAASTIYAGGNRITHSGRIWTAKWWSQGDTPGVALEVWADDGACSSTDGTSSTPAPGTDSCPGIAGWSSRVIYANGKKAFHGGRVWTARWWTLAITPGGITGVWADTGACSSSTTSRRRRSRLFRY